MVVNEHSRRFPLPPEVVGALIDTLATADDGLWPCEDWPPMRLDRPLGPGAHGGHGPVRYRVEEHVPGRSVRFRFEAPAGFDGHHGLDVAPAGDGSTLRHWLIMRTTGAARLTWPAFFRPLHDALVEDALDKATRTLGLPAPSPRGYGPAVRALRAAARLRRRPAMSEVDPTQRSSTGTASTP